MERRNEVEKSKWRERGRKGGKKEELGKDRRNFQNAKTGCSGRGYQSLSTLDNYIYIYLH